MSWVERAAALDSSAVGEYAGQVADGVIVAGPLVRLACERHIRDFEDGPGRGLRWVPEAAEDIFRFFEKVLRLDDDAPFLLLPWQRFVLGSLFGWQLADGARRFRQAYIEVGKGAGKTPMAAGVGLFGLVADSERAAEIYSGAPTQAQAAYLFADAEKMVQLSSVLRSMIDRRVNNLSHQDSFSFFRAVSSEHRGLDGKRVHFALVDEVHEHRSPLVIDKLAAGTKSRRQPLIFEITNAGFDRSTICYAHHDYSRQVLEGVVVNDEWFCYVAGLDAGDDPLTDEGCWIKANPSLGTTIHASYLRSQVTRANGIPSETNTVLLLNFCVWTRQSERAIPMPLWDACGSATIADAALVGRPCYAGLDLGQSDDFSAFVLIWDLEDGRVAVRSRFWLPEAALEKYPDRPYDAWQRLGALEVTDGVTTDYDVIEEAVAADCLEVGVRELAYDKRFAQQMALHLEGHGIVMVDTLQGFQLNEACQKLSALVADRTLCHGNSPILNWMAGNLVFRHGRYGDIRPDKEAASEKMDGMVALIMALTRLIVQPVEQEINPEVGVLTW